MDIKHGINCLAITENGPCDCDYEDRLESEIERLNALVSMQSESERCECGDVGYFVRGDNTVGWEQEQCEFCYTNPKSVFNVRNATSETVSAWQNEVKAKALEDAADYLDRHMQYCGSAPVLLMNMASELRAKGE